MKSDQWKTYRTRFLVKAKQLNSSLSFTDHLGRQHCGRKGDYLVESCDGVLSIAPRQIFEDIYVPMGLAPDPADTRLPDNDNPVSKQFRFEPLRLEKITTNFQDSSSRRNSERVARTRRAPQPVQPVRLTESRLGLM